jgi:hypothetical protein
MKTIPLTQGKRAIVNDEDFERLSGFKWNAHWTGAHWVVRRYSHMKRNQKGTWISQYVPITHEILGKKDGMIVDHRNGNPLDNRRENLRFATVSQNLCNRKVQRNNKTTGVKGVWVNPRDGRFYTCVTLNGKRRWLGSFCTLSDATHAYNEAAEKLHGDFAYIKRPEEQPA